MQINGAELRKAAAEGIYTAVGLTVAAAYVARRRLGADPAGSPEPEQEPAAGADAPSARSPGSQSHGNGSHGNGSHGNGSPGVEGLVERVVHFGACLLRTRDPD